MVPTFSPSVNSGDFKTEGRVTLQVQDETGRIHTPKEIWQTDQNGVRTKVLTCSDCQAGTTIHITTDHTDTKGGFAETSYIRDRTNRHERRKALSSKQYPRKINTWQRNR